jgi:hypothetical protein
VRNTGSLKCRGYKHGLIAMPGGRERKLARRQKDVDFAPKSPPSAKSLKNRGYGSFLSQTAKPVGQSAQLVLRPVVYLVEIVYVS